jgi:hypothetical protein
LRAIMDAMPCTVSTSAEAEPAVPSAGCLAAVAAPVGSGNDTAETATVPVTAVVLPVSVMTCPITFVPAGNAFVMAVTAVTVPIFHVPDWVAATVPVIVVLARDTTQGEVDWVTATVPLTATVPETGWVTAEPSVFSPFAVAFSPTNTPEPLSAPRKSAATGTAEPVGPAAALPEMEPENVALTFSLPVLSVERALSNDPSVPATWIATGGAASPGVPSALSSVGCTAEEPETATGRHQVPPLGEPCTGSMRIKPVMSVSKFAVGFAKSPAIYSFPAQSRQMPLALNL